MNYRFILTLSLTVPPELQDILGKGLTQEMESKQGATVPQIAECVVRAIACGLNARVEISIPKEEAALDPAAARALVQKLSQQLEAEIDTQWDQMHPGEPMSNYGYMRPRPADAFDSSSVKLLDSLQESLRVGTSVFIPGNGSIN